METIYRIKVGLLLALVGILLSGCATKYQEMGLTGGVESQQIDDRTFRVSARGNGYTSSAKVQEFVLLKAAQSTVGAGYSHFQIVNSTDTTRTGSFVIPGQATTSVQGGYGYATATTTYTPAQAISFIKPGQDVFIRMFRPQEISSGQSQGVIDARQVIKYLGAKYIKPSS